MKKTIGKVLIWLVTATEVYFFFSMPWIAIVAFIVMIIVMALFIWLIWRLLYT